MKKSYLIAGAILFFVVVWMASGQFGGAEAPAGEGGAATASHAELTRVRVKEFRAESVTREVVVNGHTAPVRSVTLRAETAGTVTALPAVRGAWVGAGETVVRLAEDNRGARVREAQALVAQRTLEFKGAQRLLENSLISEALLAQARTALDSAEAQLGMAQLDLARSTLHAPFAGILDQREVELGTYVREGDSVATVVDVDPLLVVGTVSEQEVGRLRLDATGHVRLVTGEQLAGRIRYIAAAADEATRTFRVELEVANPQRLRVTGVTAEVRVALEPVLAHRVSPSLLALDDNGTVGVKSVAADGTVMFHPAVIIRSEPDGLWLGGLPQTLRLITVGQGFVRAGEKVTAVDG